jgi:hypothetical protein
MARNRDLDLLAHRLDRAANTVPDVMDHLDEQRANIAVIAAQDISHGGGYSVGYSANPTLSAVTQLAAVEYRRQTIRDAIATMAVCVNMLEQECRQALAYRASAGDRDDIDHLDGTPRCIGSTNAITTRCEQIPSERPTTNGGEYRRARAWLTAHPATQCWHEGCTNQATTIDHVPAIIHHHHQRGTHCCQLRAACEHCNKSHGATIGNMNREPASGWTTTR